MRRRRTRSFTAAWALVVLAACPAGAAELGPHTLASFQHYIELTDRRIAAEVANPSTFLWADTISDAAKRRDVFERLRRGEVVVEKMTTLDDGHQVKIDDGLIHDWIGVVFVPGATVDAAVSLMQDYDNHAKIFSPAIVQSKMLSRDGDHFHVFLRFHMKAVISATIDTENDVVFVRPAPDRAYSSIRSTKVAEVVDPGGPDEHERQPGHGSGVLWAMNTYWRFLERDGGTYVQCEAVSLSRDLPFVLGWFIKPLLTKVPKEALAFMLGRVKDTLEK
jgi:hypothetical protein